MSNPSSFLQLLEATQRAFLGEAGALPQAARQSIVEGGDVPEALRGFVERIARHAYRVTDEDFAVLREAGFSDDQLFEIAIAASLGAGLVRLHAGRRALGRQP
jgi:alkylhydroperoxidase family enzyme